MLNSFLFIVKCFEKKEFCFRKLLSDRWGMCFVIIVCVIGVCGC